jgi:hypothetical protein
MPTQTVKYILDADTSKASSGLKSAAKTAAKLGAAVAAVGTAFFAFQKQVVDMVNNLNDLSTRSGLATDQIQALQTAFIASGQSAGSAVSLLSRFPAVLNQVQRGTGEAADQFAKLGISATDSNGNLRDSSAVFGELVSKIQRIENPTQKAAAAVAVFGRQGAALVQALGAGEFERFQHFVTEYGVKTGPQASQQAAQFQRAIALLKVTIQGVAQRAAELLGGSGGIVFFAGKIAGILVGSFDVLESTIKFFQDLAMKAFNSITIGAMKMLRVLQETSKFLGIDVQIVDPKSLDKQIKRLQQVNAEINTIQKKEGRQLFQVLTKGFEAGSEATRNFTELVRSAKQPLNDMNAGMDQLQKSTEKTAESARKLTESISPELAGARSFVSDPLQGTIEAGIGALGVAGPQAAAIGAILQSLGQIGKKSPEELKKEFKMQTEAMIKGIEVLPDLLVTILPPVLAKFIFDLQLLLAVKLPFLLLDAILRGIFEGGKFLVNELKNFFSSGDFFGSIGKAIKDAFSDIIDFFVSVGDPTQRAFMGGGRMISAQGGIRFTGADRGLAMLHEGEFVVPQSGQAPQQVQRRLDQSQGGSGPQIIINSAIVEHSAIDALVRRIEERFGAFGASTSTLFGGV